jgi:hypothetical protein
VAESSAKNIRSLQGSNGNMKPLNLPHLNSFKKLLPFLLFVTLSLFVVRNLVTTKGMIGLRHDWPTTPFSGQLQQAFLEHFFAWSTRSLGTRYNIYGVPFINLLLDFPSFFGLTGYVQSKLLLIITLLFSGISGWYLAKILRLKNTASLLSGIFYMLTPLLFVKIVSGYVNYLIGYAFQPVILAFFAKSVQTNKINYKAALIAGILYAFSWYQPQFLVMIGVWLASWTLLFVRRASFKFYVKSLIIVLLVATSIDLTVIFSLIDVFVSGPGIGPVTDYWTVYASSHSSLLDTLRLVESIFGYFNNAIISGFISPHIWQLVSILMLLIIFSPLVLPSNITKRKLSLYFSIVAILTIIIGNGTGPPFRDAYILLLNTIPFLQVFREPSHILAMTSLAYSVLLGICIDLLLNKLNKIRFRKLLLSSDFVVGLLIFTVLSVYAYPFYSGDFRGNIQTYDISPSYKDLYDHLIADPAPYRILWVPMSQPISYGTKYPGLDPMLIYSPKPTFYHGLPATGLQGPYTTFIASTIHENRTAYLEFLLSLASVKYIINRIDVSTKIQHFVPMFNYDPETYNSYLNEKVVVGSLLASQKDIVFNPILSRDNFFVYENPNYLPRVYATDNIVLIVGDLSTLVSLSYTQTFEKIIEDNAVFVFSSQLNSKELRSLLPYIKTIVFDNNNIEELIFTYIPEQEKIIINQLGSFANITENPFRRWSSLHYNWWWHNWRCLASLDNPVITKFPSTLKVPLKIQKDAKYELWAKVYFSPRASQLSFHLNNEPIFVLSTFSQTEEGFKWIRICDNLNLTQGDYTLKISSSNGEELLAKLILIEKGVQESYISEIEELMKQKDVLNIIELEKMDKNPNAVLNPSFEEMQNDIPVFWSHAKPGFNILMDKTTFWSGRQSLKVYTNITSNFTWSWIRGKEFFVNAGETYEIVTHVRYKNVKQTHIVVEGYNSSSNQWVQLVQVPAGLDGSSDWCEFSYMLKIPQGISKLRVILNAGWVDDAQKGEAITWFDDIIIRPEPELQIDASTGEFLAIRNTRQLEIPLHPMLLNIGNWTFSLRYRAPNSLTIFTNEQKYTVPPQDDFSWANIPLHSTTVRILADSADIDVAYAYFPGNQKKANRQGATFKMLSPANYEVQIDNASTPFVLVFTDTYDPGWEIYIKGDNNNLNTIHFIANSFANAWCINKTGDLTITLEYVPQRLYDFELKVSFLTLVILIVAVLIPTSKMAKLEKLLKDILAHIRLYVPFTYFFMSYDFLMKYPQSILDVGKGAHDLH